MRVFVGIKASENLQSEILNFLEEYKRPKDRIRWTPPENLHITLIPPWEIEEQHQLSRMLKQVSGVVSPFNLDFNEVVMAPRLRKRMIWAIPKVLPQRLFTLQDALFKAFEKDNTRPFKPHMTLARFHPQDISQFAFKNMKEPVYWSMRIEKVTLFRSVPSSTGSYYHCFEHLLL